MAVPVRPYGGGTLKVGETRESWSKLIFKGLVPAKVKYNAPPFPVPVGYVFKGITTVHSLTDEDFFWNASEYNEELILQKAVCALPTNTLYSIQSITSVQMKWKALTTNSRKITF